STAALGVVLATGLASCGPTDYSSVTVLAEPTPVVGTTFAWKEVAPSTSQEMYPGIDNPIFRQRVEQAFNTAMAAKGYQQVSDAKTADLVLAYRVGVQAKSQLETQTTPGGYYGGGPMMCGRFGCGGGWGWGYYGPPQTSVTQVNFTEGGLMLDVMAGPTDALVWRALYKDRVTADSATQASLDAVAARLVTSLPNAGGAAATAAKK
ncbi:MAG: DUF4136 domain-containing protein, partial [Polymorphobacter sp.]